MEIQDKVSFVAEVSSMMRTKEYKEFIETLQRKETEIREEVFSKYFSPKPFIENQIYNEKNATIELMKAILEAKDMAESLSAGKYLIEYADESLENGTKQIKEGMGGLNSGLTMGVYTETDLQIRVADSYKLAREFYDLELDKCKKDAKDDSTLDTPKED